MSRRRKERCQSWGFIPVYVAPHWQTCLSNCVTRVEKIQEQHRQLARVPVLNVPSKSLKVLVRCIKVFTDAGLTVPEVKIASQLFNQAGREATGEMVDGVLWISLAQLWCEESCFNTLLECVARDYNGAAECTAEFEEDLLFIAAKIVIDIRGWKTIKEANAEFEEERGAQMTLPDVEEDEAE